MRNEGLEIRLLGGFEARSGSDAIQAFESQKARGLFAYLVCNSRRTLSRDHLAGLFWPEEPSEAARHNLRQALYNLRSSLARAVPPPAPLITSHHHAAFEPRAGDWLDVDEFEAALHRGGADGDRAGDLDRAVRLYRGDFLAGFFLKDSPAFEEWVLGEQERLRDAAIHALRELTAHHLAAGGHAAAQQYARRLLVIDPLSEEAHRQLMVLYALGGRRSRALADYEELAGLLDRELGLSPEEETTRLYRAILAEKLPLRPEASHGEPAGPQVPLVGREASLARLRGAWTAVLAGKGRLTLVSGETGVGKTRLIKTFLHEAAAGNRVTVLQGGAYELCRAGPYQPFAQALRNAVASEAEVAGRPVEPESAALLACLVPLVPELAELRPDLPAARPPAGAAGRARIDEAVARFFTLFPGPLVLFLDDLQWADPSSFRLLRALLPRLEEVPLWIISTYRCDAAGHAGEGALRELEQLAEAAPGTVDRLDLERLQATDVEAIAASLLETGTSSPLARFLMRASGGLPLLVAELVNLLWDEGALVPNEAAGEEGRWRLTRELPTAAPEPPIDLAGVTRQRLARLPASARRLLTLGAVAGPTFDAELLRRVDDELPEVVERSLQVLLERWFIRQSARYWADSRRERDLAMWASGTHRGTFEFAHKSLRGAIHASLDPLRAEVLHREVAQALERRYAGRTEEIAEVLADHYAVAKMRDRLVSSLEAAAVRAVRATATETAVRFYDEALEVAGELCREAAAGDERRRWEARRRTLAGARRRLLAG